MKKHLLTGFTLLLFIITILLGVTACNMKQDATQNDKDVAELINESRFNDTTKANDANFLVETAWMNSHEIALGQLGTKRSKMPEILVLSKMLVEDHNNAAEQLKKIADDKSIILPVSTEKNEDEGTNKLLKQSNATFDKAFVDLVVQYHKDAIDKFEAANLATSDKEIKGFITAVLPNLKKHLEEAETIQKTIQ